MTNTLKPHKHAALIKEWAKHTASGAVAAGWYCLEESSSNGALVKIGGLNSPTWAVDNKYRIVMTAKNPDCKPPKKKFVIELELTDEQVQSILANLHKLGYLTTVNTALIRDALFKAFEDAK